MKRPPPEMPHIAIHGGSIADGDYDFDKRGWAGHLASTMSHRRYEFLALRQGRLPVATVANHAEGGQTLQDVIARLPYDMIPYAAARRKVGIFAVGVSDSRPFPGSEELSEPAMPIDDFAVALNALIGICDGLKISPIFVGAPPIIEHLVAPRSTDVRVRQYNAVINACAQEHGAPFLNSYACLAEPIAYNGETYSLEKVLAKKDGLHPNRLGHEILYHNLNMQAAVDRALRPTPRQST